MAKIEVSFIESERKLVMNEINALGYGFNYEYSVYSVNTIIIPDIGKYDKEKFIYFLKENQIIWSN
ncbi:hypothetical protein [Arcobacter caeni]|uniref:Uncharacterized protein n=1 Tax=Arcobacter caeni TaxID=1912877 RepID=A0A363CW44_9BACT|nr:hypothetical protein [Arcobacter caeni]PUE63318.1 hypothetical protein B0174_11960 [Arcobacter caeni]